MTDRVCKVCGADISHRDLKAKYCSKLCLQRAWRDQNRSKSRAYSAKWKSRNKPNTGPFREKRKCYQCGAHYTAKSSTAKYCSTRCKERTRDRDARNEYERQLRQNNLDKFRESDRRRYAKMRDEDPDRYQKFCAAAAEASRRWRSRDPEYARSKDREWQRRVSAESALSAILLPTVEPPEV